jgi:hypothetical protein
MRLRVHIDQQNSLAGLSNSARQVYGYCCLATTTFLIDNRYGLHSASPTHKMGDPKKSFFYCGKRLHSVIKSAEHLFMYFGKKM